MGVGEDNRVAGWGTSWHDRTGYLDLESGDLDVLCDLELVPSLWASGLASGKWG